MATFTNQSKNTTSFTGETKNSASFTGQSKNTGTITKQTKNAATFENQGKSAPETKFGIATFGKSRFGKGDPCGGIEWTKQAKEQSS